MTPRQENSGTRTYILQTSTAITTWWTKTPQRERVLHVWDDTRHVTYPLSFKREKKSELRGLCSPDAA